MPGPQEKRYYLTARRRVSHQGILRQDTVRPSSEFVRMRNAK